MIERVNRPIRCFSTILIALVVSALPAQEEVVRGMYYFEDQGLYTEIGGERVYSERYHDGVAIDFGGRLVFTFDDVVFDESLDRILDVLAAHEIHAVFFLSGRHIADADRTAIAPRLERMIDEGHLIGNHSFTHDQFDRGIYADGYHDERDIGADLDRLEALVDDMLGHHYAMRYVRPPFGIRGNGERSAEQRMAIPGAVDRVLAERGQDLVLWHINSLDFLIVPGSRYSPEQLPSLAAERVRASTGGVLLFHSNRFTASVIEETVSAVLSTRTSDGTAVRSATIEEIYTIKYGPDRSLTLVR